MYLGSNQEKWEWAVCSWLATTRRGRECSWQVVWALKEQEFWRKVRGVLNGLQNLKNAEASFTAYGVDVLSTGHKWMWHSQGFREVFPVEAEGPGWRGLRPNIAEMMVVAEVTGMFMVGPTTRWGTWFSFGFAFHLEESEGQPIIIPVCWDVFGLWFCHPPYRPAAE